MWNAVGSFALKAWTYAGPVLGGMVQEGVSMLGSVIAGENPEQDLEALKSEEKELDRKKATFEKELQTKREVFLREQRDLDARKKSLLREQDNLRVAEDRLENRQKVVTKHNDTEKKVAKMRKRLFEKLESYELNQEILREKQEETDREYAEHRKRLEEAYKKLKQNQSEIIHLLKTQPAIQKGKELNALTDSVRHNCEVFAEDPDAMVDQTKITQNKYSLKLMEVRNVMLEGHFFPGSMKVWADAALLDLHMLGFLVTKGVYSYRPVEIAKDLYQGYWNQLKVAHTKHKPVTKGPDQLQEIEYLLVTQFTNFDRLMSKSVSSEALPPSLGLTEGDTFHSSSNRAFGAAGDQFDCSPSRRHSGSVREGGTLRRPSAAVMVRRGDTGPTREEDRFLILEEEMAALRMEMSRRYDSPGRDTWDRSEQHKPSRSSSRSLALFPSVRESARHPGRTFESDQRGKQRYSQDPPEYAAGCNHSRNKRESQPNPQESLDIDHQQNHQRSRYPSRYQQQNQEEHYISCGTQGHRGMHDHDGGGQERQKTGGRRNALAVQQPSRPKYQERPHSPDDHPESLDESSSSSDEQVSQHESSGGTITHEKVTRDNKLCHDGGFGAFDKKHRRGDGPMTHN